MKPTPPKTSAAGRGMLFGAVVDRRRREGKGP